MTSGPAHRRQCQSRAVGSDSVGERRRSWWGWGWEDQALDDAQVRALAKPVAAALARDDLEPAPAPLLEQIELPPPRVRAPAPRAPMSTDPPYDRPARTYP